MDEGSPLFGLLIFLICIIINMIFYGFSAAVQSISETNLSKRLEEGVKKAVRILHITEKPTKYINTVHTVTFIADLVLGAVVLKIYGNLFAHWLMREFFKGQFILSIYVISYVIVGLIILFIGLSLGVLIPKKFASRYCESWAYGLVNIVNLFIIIFTPITIIINLLTCLILKIFKMDNNDRVEEVTEEEIMSMINEGHEQGTILASEAEMINNIFELGDKEASDIMTHRKNIVSINGDMTLEETVKYILSENNSRFPVFIENIDNIIGILHLKDAMIFNENEGLRQSLIKEIPGLLRKAYFIPETRKLDMLFKDMQSGKIHMEIVVDEYGQTAGLVAMEDILEEIVGNIFDEYDEVEDNIILQEDGTYLINGSTPLEDLEDMFDMDFGEYDYDTLNGFLISKLDRIPSMDDRPDIHVDGYHYEIMNVENKMISLVRVTIPVVGDSQVETDKDENELN